MRDDVLDEISAFSPSTFFAISCDIHYADQLLSWRSFAKKHLLPDLSDFLSEDSFATLSIGWSEEGIRVDVLVNKAFENNRSDDFRLGDNIELFFDTRDIKTSGFNTRFCHHFLFLPDSEEDSTGAEITQFRTEDTHPLCDSRDFKIEATFQKKTYQMKIFIPAHCLHGYDPSSFDRIGFNYRINRARGESQNFSVSSQHFSIEQQSSLWCSCKMLK